MKKRSFVLSLAAILVLSLCFSACGSIQQTAGNPAPGGSDDALSVPETDIPFYTAYNTTGLLVTPVPATKDANELGNSELLAIYEALYAQAAEAYTFGLFKLDETDTFNEDAEAGVYWAITNFESQEEILRNYTAIFSYELVQATIFPEYFILPYTLGGLFDNDYALIHEHEGKLYLNSNYVGYMMSDKIADAEIIYKDMNTFKVRLTQEWVDGSTLPYVLTILNQNGIWVLDNFYWYDLARARD